MGGLAMGGLAMGGLAMGRRLLGASFRTTTKRRSLRQTIKDSQASDVVWS